MHHAVRSVRLFLAMAAVVAAGVLAPDSALAVETISAGSLSAGDHTWTGLNDPYVVDGMVTVAVGQSLTIEPGVVVKFKTQFSGIRVEGALFADGTIGNEVILTSFADDTAGGDTNGNQAPTTPAGGQWYQLLAIDGGNIVMTHSRVRYGGYGSGFHESAVRASGSASTAKVSYSVISDSQQAGVTAFNGGHITLDSSTIERNRWGVFALDAHVEIKGGSRIINNRNTGVEILQAAEYTGPVSSILQSEITGNVDSGVLLRVNPDVPTSMWPYGMYNNISGNDAADQRLQLSTYYVRLDNIWTNNYFGDVVAHDNDTTCGTQFGAAYGGPVLVYSDSPASPLEGPADGQTYSTYPEGVPCRSQQLMTIPFAAQPYGAEFLLGSMSTVCGDYGTSVVAPAEAAAANPTACVSDPINTLTGAFTHRETDINSPGQGVTFQFARGYNSIDPDATALGSSWRHAYSDRLQVLGEGQDLVLTSADGQRSGYSRLDDGSYESVGAGAVAARLQVDGSEYVLTRKDQVQLRFSAAGLLLSVRDRNGYGLEMAYDSNQRLWTVTDAASRVATLAYQADGKLASVTMTDGRSVSYGYTSGLLSSFTDVRGKTWTYAYDSRGLLESQTNPLLKRMFLNTYDASGRVVTQLDPLNKPSQIAYTRPTATVPTATTTLTDPAGKEWTDVYENNRLIRREQPGGRITQYQYDAGHNVKTIIDPRNHTTTMTYDARGNMLTRVSAAPFLYEEVFTYDINNRVLTAQNRRGFTTSYQYDSAGNLFKVTRPGTNVTTINRDPVSKLIANVVDPRNQTTTYGYDDDLNIDTVTTPEGRKTTLVYDAAGRVSSVVDPRGNVTGANAALYRASFTHDPSGRMRTRTDALGRLTEWTYDDAGNLKTFINAKLRTWTFDYNNANQRTTIIDPRLEDTIYSYDDRGLLDSITTAEGRRTTFAYDDIGTLKTKTLPAGNVTGANPLLNQEHYTYDAAGNLRTITDPLSRVTEYVYDELGRVTIARDGRLNETAYTYDGSDNIRTVSDEYPSTTTYNYDALERLDDMVDARGKTWDYQYDPAGNLTFEITPTGGKTGYTYDNDGLLDSAIDPRGYVSGADPADFTTQYAHDAAGYPELTTDPLDNATAYDYDRVGRLASVQDARNYTTVYGYDEINQLTSVDPSGATPATTYDYDLVGNRTERIDAKQHLTEWEHDLDGLLTARELNNSARFSYGYDANSNRTSIVDAIGNAAPSTTDGTTAYGYDPANQLRTINYSDATPDVSYDYDAAGNRDTMTDGAGTEVTLHDAVNRPDTITRGTDVTDLNHDAAGNVTHRTYPGQPTTVYAYDNDSRLETVTQGTSITTYGYDQAGNLESSLLPNAHRQDRTWDPAGRLTGVTNTNTTTNTVLSESLLTLDPVGNPLRITDRTEVRAHAYDEQNRLLNVCYQPRSVDPAATATLTVATCRLRAENDYATYTYDAVGNRLSTTTPDGQSTATYNSFDQLTALQTPGGTITYDYDPNGNQTRVGTRTFAYDQAGRMTRATIPDPPTTTPGGSPIRYAGEQLDPTGLYHLRARQYDPTTGRFTAEDPVEAPVGVPYSNTYHYGANNPLVNVDPSGMTSIATGVGASYGGGAGAAGGFTDPNPSTGREVAPSGTYGCTTVNKPILNHQCRPHPTINCTSTTDCEAVTKASPDTTVCDWNGRCRSVEDVVGGSNTVTQDGCFGVPDVKSRSDAASYGSCQSVESGNHSGTQQGGYGGRADISPSAPGRPNSGGVSGGRGAPAMSPAKFKALVDRLGLQKVRGQLSNGQAVYKDPKSGLYFSKDVGNLNVPHSGGVFKGATSPAALRSARTRSGTYDGNLRRIGG